MKKMLAITALCAVFASGVVVAKSAKEDSSDTGDRSPFSERAIAERLKPVGSVCVAGKVCGATEVLEETVEVASAVAAASGRAGDAVYNASCMACHTTGAAGAPRIGDKAAWASRIKQGHATLLKHTVEGFKAMPPRGMCMSCSDEELQAALDYLLEKSQ